MDQRMFLAVGLSMLVILGFYLVTPMIYPPATPPHPAAERKEAAGAPATAAKANGEAAQPAAPARPKPAEVPSRVIEVNTPHYRAAVDTRGGRLTSLELKDYKLDKDSIDWGDLVPPVRALLTKDPVHPNVDVQMVKQAPHGTLPLTVEFVGDDALTQAFDGVVYASDQVHLSLGKDAARPATLTLTGNGPGGLTVRKLITFHPDSFVIDYEVQVINYGTAARPLQLVNDFGLGPNTNHARATRGHYGPMYRSAGKIHKSDTDDIKQVLRVAEPNWLAMSDTYFITAAAPESPVDAGQYTLVPGALEGKYPVAEYGIALPRVELEPQKMIGGKFKLYMGPKGTNEMLVFGSRLEESLDLTLDFIASPMLAMLRWFYSFTGNYGVAIIMLTIVVRVVLFPLTYKGMVSMKRMQKLQPKVAALRERMKGDKEKTNREMMEMYRRYKVNPLSGCLPIVFQIPIFFALYSALLGAIELRHSPFMWWVVDLSSKDGLYVFPLLMGASMFFQQRLTPTSLDPMQAKIMLWMPVIFTFFMLNFPAGLTLYWFTSNLLSIAQQLIINRVQVPEFAD